MLIWLDRYVYQDKIKGDMNYRIELVPNNIVIQEKKTTGKGEEIWVDWGYYTSFRTCLIGLLELGIKGKDFKDFQASLAKSYELTNKLGQELDRKYGSLIKTPLPESTPKIEEEKIELPPKVIEIAKQRGRPKKS